jgi:hypothetical protein
MTSILWFDLFLIPSIDRHSCRLLSFRARYSMAKMLFNNQTDFAGNLDDVAVGLGLKPSFFRRAVSELVKLNWLQVQSVKANGRGRPSKAYVCSARLVESGGVHSRPFKWQIQLAEILLFGEQEIFEENIEEEDSNNSSNNKPVSLIPERWRVVLAALVLSSNQSGFVCGLPKAELASRTGIVIDSLSAYFKHLRDAKCIFHYPGGVSEKVVGAGRRVKSAYQINIPRLFEFLPNIDSRVVSLDVYEDPTKDLIFDAGLVTGWAKDIREASPQNAALKNVYSDLESKLTLEVSRTLKDKIYIRVLAAVSDLLSCQDIRVDLKRLDEDFYKSRLEKKMITRLVTSGVVGITHFNNHKIDSYEALIRMATEVGEIEPITDNDELMLIISCITSMRLVLSFYSNYLGIWEALDYEEPFSCVIYSPFNNGELVYYILDEI